MAMQTEPQITFKNLPHSDYIEANIREKIGSLEKHFDKITSCRVVVESPHHRHHKGNIYHITIDLNVPGKELVVKKNQEENHAHEDVYVAIRDAFDAMERQLEEYVRQLRGDVKRHETA